jgi:hypothetical protein
MGHKTAGILTKVVLGMSLLVFSFAVINNIDKQLWNDEIYTLDHFTLVQLQKTISDYHVPNNHIFYNLINSLVLKTFGIESIDSLLHNPVILRIISFLFSIITCIFVFRTTLSLFNQKTAWLALVILMTSIVFTNFALQVRGYSLSMMLSSIILFYHSTYQKKPSRKSLVFLLLFSSLLIYSILSNLWYVLAAIALSLIMKKWKPALAYAGGIALAALLYLPALNSFVGNETMQRQESFPFDIFWFYIPKLFYYFIGHRYLLILFIGVAIILLFKRYRKETSLLVIFLLLPFFFSFLNRQIPPDRVFLFFVPIMAIFTAYCIQFILKRFSKWEPLLFILFVFYLNVSFIFALTEVEHKLSKNLDEGIRKQNLIYNYYLHTYNPKEIADFCSDKKPVFIISSEPHDIIYYLNSKGIKISQAGNIDSLAIMNEYVWGITNFPYQTMDSLQKIHPHIEIFLENAPAGYYAVLRFEIKKN